MSKNDEQKDNGTADVINSNLNGEMEVDQREPWQKNPKFNFKLIVWISFGFFATSAAWSVYNSQVPIILNGLLPNRYFLIGFIMTLDNIIGAVLQPYTGNLSDRTRSKLGRRKPFIFIGLPLSALFLLLLPIFGTNLVLFIIVLLLFCTTMAFWRAPVVSLMPDFVPPKDRSKGNAIVNILGGIGSAVVALVAGEIIKKSGVFDGFLFVAIIMLVAMGVLHVGVKEPDTSNWDFSQVVSGKRQKKPGIVEEFRVIIHEEEKSPIYMMAAIFFWFLAEQAIESLLSLYATQILGLGKGLALQLVFVVSISFIIFAIPASILAKRITRRKTIIIGLIIDTSALFSMALFLVSKEQVILIIILLAMFGMGWAFVNVNSIAMLWEMAPTPKHVGTYTGLYYFASFLAAVVGPITLGYTMEYITGLEYLFHVSGFIMLIPIIFMILVKRGEPELTEEEKLAKQKAIEGLSDEMLDD
ncbi:MAG: MFS transporter [Promethearchaeota archaeon]